MQVTANRIDEYFQGLFERLESVPLPMGELMPLIREGFAKNFAAAADSVGTPWQSRKEAGDGHPLLIETAGPGAGSLFQATQGGAGAVESVGDRDLMIGVDKGVDLGGIRGAAVHNFGYSPRYIPQREYLYASEETLDKAAEAIADAALEQIFGG